MMADERVVQRVLRRALDGSEGRMISSPRQPARRYETSNCGVFHLTRAKDIPMHSTAAYVGNFTSNVLFNQVALFAGNDPGLVCEGMMLPNVVSTHVEAVAMTLSQNRFRPET